MGSVCCVAARDRTIANGPSSEVLQQNVRYSPSWSFRWDIRRRVVGEEMSINWSSDGGSTNYGLGVKSGTTVDVTCASEVGSPLDSFHTLTWQKSPVSEGNTRMWSLPPPDPPISRNSSEVKESIDSAVISDPSPTKLSPSVGYISSLSASPLSSQSHLLPAKSIPSRRLRLSPGHQLLGQVSDSRIPGLKSPNFSISEETSSFVLPGWGNELIRGSNGGSSDSWSIPPSSEIMGTSYMERWSFDSESLYFNREKVSRCNGGVSASPFDSQTCGVCSKLLTERSFWGSQKVIATNELAVVAVLICGHVYHAECLENMTSEINKYEPTCPICTLGKKQVLKLSEKILKAEAEVELKARYNRRSRSRVIDSELENDLFEVNRQKSSGHGEKGLKLVPSRSLKGSFGRPFLRRHFSFGSKGSRSSSENQSTWKRGFFWTKSSE